MLRRGPSVASCMQRKTDAAQATTARQYNKYLQVPRAIRHASNVSIRTEAKSTSRNLPTRWYWGALLTKEVLSSLRLSGLHNISPYDNFAKSACHAHFTLQKPKKPPKRNFHLNNVIEIFSSPRKCRANHKTSFLPRDFAVQISMTKKTFNFHRSESAPIFKVVESRKALFKFATRLAINDLLFV